MNTYTKERELEDATYTLEKAEARRKENFRRDGSVILPDRVSTPPRRRGHLRKEFVYPVLNTNRHLDREEKQPEMEEKTTTTSAADEEEYVLEAFGDISLSEANFLPPPTTTLSPHQKTVRRKPPMGPKVPYGSTRRTHKPKAPSLSKARKPIDATEWSFDSLVANYKENSNASFSRTMGAAASEAVMYGQRPLLDLQNLGGEAVIPGRGSHDVVENSGYTRKSDESAVKSAAGRGTDVEPRHDPKTHQTSRGNARPPIPNWNDVQSWQSSQRATGNVGITAVYKLA